MYDNTAILGELCFYSIWVCHVMLMLTEFNQGDVCGIDWYSIFDNLSPESLKSRQDSHYMKIYRSIMMAVKSLHCWLRVEEVGTIKKWAQNVNDQESSNIFPNYIKKLP